MYLRMYMYATGMARDGFMELKGKRPADSVLHEHNAIWTETDLPVSVSGALRYLRERMFQKKDMMVIIDDHRVRLLALALYRYRSGNIENIQTGSGAWVG